MNFLVPLYLFGALAVAIPIYLHLRRKPPKDSVDFSSLMFLEPTKHQPLKRKSQLENLPLLLLRCLALLLLAAMFGRPFLRGGDAEGREGQKRTVILLDTSASMRRDGVWENAQRAAVEAISGIRSDGACALMTVDQAPRTIAGFADWKEADPGRRKEIATAALDSLEPSWSGSDLGSGLIAAAELLGDASADDESPRPTEIIVISDLQSGAALDAVTDAAWPSGLQVTLVPIETPARTNVTLAAAPTRNPDQPAIRVRNDPHSEESRFEIQAGAVSIPAIVPPGESRVIQLDRAVSEVRISGDAHDFDNRLFLAPREPAGISLQFMGAGKPDDSNRPEYYFRRAFGPSRILRPRFVEDLAEEPAILAIARPLSDTESSQVRRHLGIGHRVLLLLTSTEMAKTLGELAGLKSPPSLREHEGRYALLEEIDFDHPTLREFGDPRWRDFTEVHFWNYRTLDLANFPEETSVIARYDTGDPAWIEIPAGEGSLLVMTSSWHPRDSQLSLSTKFLPLLYSLFADRGPQVSGVRQFFVGEPLPLEEGETTLTHPSGKSQDLPDQELFRPSEPGIYRVSDGQRSRSFAVNLRPSESELTPLGTKPLAALGVPVDSEAASAETSGDPSKRHLRDREAEANQGLWRWAVVILLSMLVIESWLASRPGHVSPQPEGATT